MYELIFYRSRVQVLREFAMRTCVGTLSFLSDGSVDLASSLVGGSIDLASGTQRVCCCVTRVAVGATTYRSWQAFWSTLDPAD